MKANQPRRRSLPGPAWPGAGGLASPVVESPVPKAAPPTALPPLRRVRAGLLDVAYAEFGPSEGQVAILLHGWPYDIQSFAEAGPALAAKGYRVIAPYMRGFGPTRFLSADTFRNGQPSVVALDTIAVMA